MTLDEFLTLVHEEIGLDVSQEDARRPLTDLGGWDSVHLLALLRAVEQSTGAAISLPDVLEAGTLEGVHAAATAGG